jgi:uncharacterized protein (DUF169 family)
MDIGAYNKCGSELIEFLGLRFSPVAFRFIRDLSDIPVGTVRPAEALGGRFAACQGFALARRERRSLAMLGADHACVWPMIGYGMVPFGPEDYEKAGPELFGGAGNLEYNLFIKGPEKARTFFRDTFPKMPEKNILGILVAPLETAKFEPEAVLIYARPTQLRSLLMAVKYITGEVVASQFDSVESCLYSTVSAILDNSYKITVPDPGEYKRAYCEEDEMIFTAPGARLAELTGALLEMAGMGLGYRGLNKDMEPMAAGGFYAALLKKWRLM